MNIKKCILFSGLSLGLSMIANADLGMVLPPLSDSRLMMTGDINDDRGVAAINPDAHDLVSLNAPDTDKAYRYLVGREQAVYTAQWIDGSWSAAGNTATESAGATGSVGMNSTSLFFSAGANYDDLDLRFGAVGGASLYDTWNLGDDINGVNWFGDAANPVEERIYAATPANVEAALYYQDEKILTFGYVDFNMMLTYAVDRADDEIAAYTDPTSYAKVDGLQGAGSLLADALVSDFDAGGGQAQLYFDSIQTTSRSDFYDSATGDIYGIFSFSGSIMAVPEPRDYALGLSVLMLAVAFIKRRR